MIFFLSFFPLILAVDFLLCFLGGVGRGGGLLMSLSLDIFFSSAFCVFFYLNILLVLSHEYVRRRAILINGTFIERRPWTSICSLIVKLNVY